MREDNRENILYVFYAIKAICESPEINQLVWQGILQNAMEKLNIVLNTEPVELSESAEE